MKVIEIVGFGGPEVLQIRERPTPEPGAGELLVRVAAAGVNRPDLMQREGRYPPPRGASDIPGLEVAGTVERVGEGVSGWRVGQQVCALVSGGGYSEYCLVPAPQALPVPAGLSLIEAAGIPETYFTVWTNVFQRGRLQGGESLLVHGGTSGIGTTAIQLARAFGATVYATAGTDEKCRAAEHLGAIRAINYRTEDFVEVVRDATGGRGVDIILDIIGGDYFPRNLEALAVEGRLVQIARQQGSRVAFDLNVLLVKRLTITGSTLRPRTVEQKGEIARELREKVWPLLERGDVRPVIDRTYPLEQAGEAHRLLEQSRHVGKVILRIVD